VKILGIDTTTQSLCIGIYDSGRIYEYNLQLERRHSVLAVTTIQRVLEALCWKAQEVDYFACGIGPGSFTGVRIGTAAVKGLAWSLHKPVIGVSSLDILAANAPSDGIIMPAVDARRSLIYCSIYRKDASGLKRIAPYMLLPVEDFIKKAKQGSVIFGDALPLYREKILNHVKGAIFLDKDYWQLAGRNIIAPALQKIKEGRLNTAFDVAPLYLYPKECQIKK